MNARQMVPLGLALAILGMPLSAVASQKLYACVVMDSRGAAMQGDHLTVYETPATSPAEAETKALAEARRRQGPQVASAECEEERLHRRTGAARRPGIE